MTEHIILTKEEADKVRGITTPGHALDPVPLADGVSFILPLEVLSDPAHAKALADHKTDQARPVDLTDARKIRVVAEAEFVKEADVKAEETKGG